MKFKASSEASAAYSHVAKVCLILGATMAGVTAEPVWAGPSRPHVVNGNVTFETRGHRTIIRASDGSIINYLNFNIAPGEVVRFIQPSQFARVLNRITGSDPSQIAGTLRANGHVYIVNPAGVFFHNGAVVNVNGLHAAAGSLSNARFLAGSDRYTNLTGDVVNEGAINANRVDLVGKHVANHGDINARGGIIAMVAGNDVTIMQNGERIAVKVDGTRLTDQATPHAGGTTPDMTADPGVDNTGTVNAGHGHVVLGAGDLYSLAVRNSGAISASAGSVTVAATDGLIHNTATGTISADVNMGTAGEVVVQGPSILNNGAITADANRGRAGYVEVTSQNHTYLTDGSVVSASGGDDVARGGEVLVHSYDGLTVAASGAEVSVHGGALGGDGGFAEVSGKNLTFNAYAAVQATDGYDAGTLLLDPRTIFITDTGGDDSFVNDGVVLFGDGLPTQDIAVSDEALEAIAGDILLQALQDIYVLQRVDFVNNNNLTMEAGRTIAINERLTGLNNLELRASMTDATGHVFINTPLDLGGKAIVEGSRIFLNGFVVTSGDEQEYFGAVDLCQDTTLTATFVNFHGTVDSTTDGDHGLTVRGHGNKDGIVTFADQVGGDRRLEYLSVLGDSFVDGGLVRTKLFQTYLGETLLGDDTNMISTDLGLIRFGGPVDGAFALNIFTGGLTRFDGVVGGAPGGTLTSVLTDAPGQTQLGADMNASDFIEINDPARLVADVEITGDNRVQFSSTIDGDFDGPRHDLIVNSAYTIFGSDATGLALLRTDANGLTQIGLANFGKGGADVVDEDVTITGLRLDFRDDVAIIANGILTGRDFVKFHKTLNGPHHMDVFSDKFIYFGGDVGTGLGDEGVGSSDALLSLDATVVDQSLIDDNLIIFDGNHVLVVGDINLNANGRNAPARVASIAARNFGGITFESLEGDILFGKNEKFTALGNLAFIAPNGSLTVGDLNAFGNIFVDTPVINIRKRGPGQILNHQGQYVDDNGTTIVVFGGVSGTAGTTVNLIGSGANPVFAARVLADLSGPAAEFVKRAFAALAEINFTFQGTVLDLAPPIFTGQDLGTAFAFAPTRVRDRIYLDPFVVRNSGDLGLSMRDMNPEELRDTVTGRELYNDSISQAGVVWSDQPIVTTRLRRAAVLDALATNDAVFYKVQTDVNGAPVLDENGQPVMVDRHDEVKQVFADSWKSYQDELANVPAEIAGDAATQPPPTFISYLENDPDQSDAYGYAVGTRDLLVSLRASGLTGQELDASHAKVLERVSPTADWHEFRNELLRSDAAEQPVQARTEGDAVDAG
jgi:filamentous hemagglutinin family protein